MRVLVVYESRRGRTRRAAEAVAEAARRETHDVTVRSIAEASSAEVQETDLLFVGTWVEGFILSA